MTTAFVAGATGYTGREVVRQLAATDCRTIAHVRPDSPRLGEWTERFSQWGAEPDQTAWTPEAMAETLAALQPDVVFGLLGTTKARGRRVARAGGEPESQSYEQVDVALTVMLLEAAVAAGNRPRFVYLSSLGVHAAALGPYLQARWKVEERLRASDVPWTIARPSFISGPGRDDARPGERVGALVTDGLLAVAGILGARRTRDRLGSMNNAELAAGLVRYALDPNGEGRIVDSADLR